METNAFDTSVMPSARAARAKEWRMVIPLPVYPLIVGIISAIILAIVAWA
jgi:hypothetical protein